MVDYSTNGLRPKEKYIKHNVDRKGYYEQQKELYANVISWVNDYINDKIKTLKSSSNFEDIKSALNGTNPNISKEQTINIFLSKSDFLKEVSHSLINNMVDSIPSEDFKKKITKSILRNYDKAIELIIKGLNL